MVVFTATNAAGLSNFTSNISVYSPGFSAVPDQGPHPLTVTFTDSGTGYPQPSAWYWDFGDGVTSSFRNSTHQYVLPGSYDVKFRVTSPAGMAWVNRSAAVEVT
jgi:PKD repeat protein